MLYNSYRQGALADKEIVHTEPGAPIQTRDPYRRCVISIYKGPLQKKDPYMIYMQGCKGLLQTRAPSCKQGSLHYIQISAPYKYAGRQEPVQTGAPTDKVTLHKSGHYIQRVPTDTTRSPYRQGALIDKEFIQQMNPIGTPTDAE